MVQNELLGPILIPCVTAAIWLRLVNQIVTAPYLDEYFHARQALSYLAGQWHIWDPKITTPPGLYLVSWFQLSPFKALFDHNTSVLELRSVNVICILCLSLLLPKLLRLVHGSVIQRTDEHHTALTTKHRRIGNLEHQYAHTAANIILLPPLFFFSALYYTDILSAYTVLLTIYFGYQGRTILTVLTGLASLCFRQTNIFWVAIYLGGVTLQSVFNAHGFNGSDQSYGQIMQLSWQKGQVFDPEIDKAGVVDYIFVIVSYLVATLVSLHRVIKALIPQVILIAVFAVFVIWNGGVVLGDKSNHVATIHIAQLLYLCPYLIFFSLPLTIPALFHISQQPLPWRRSRISYIAALTPFLGLALVIIGYNTMIHPFTLADNRHYAFYIFKLFRLYPYLRYAAAPIYVLCGWLAFCLISTPITTAAAMRKEDDKATKDRSGSDASSGNVTASWVLIWLLTSTLSLCSAPLVEPRYFIMPYITWRMHISPCISLKRYSLWIETAWLLLINLVTAYMFLYRGFEWSHERGQVQRFMW